MHVSTRGRLSPLSAFGFALLLALPLATLAGGSAFAGPPAPLLDLPNAAMPLPDLLTAGQPSEDGLAAAAAAGYKTIINLRAPSEEIGFDESAKADELGLRYIALPIAGAAGLTRDNARLLGDLLDDPELYPAVLHCGSSNRVGALLALRAFYFEGIPAEQALELGRRAGMLSLEPVVAETLAAEPAPAGGAADRPGMGAGMGAGHGGKAKACGGEAGNCGCGGQCGGEGCACGGQGALGKAEGPAAALNAEVQRAVETALADEYRAEAFYRAVIAQLGQVRPFSQVVMAEGRHAAMLASVLERRGLAVPPAAPAPAAPAPAADLQLDAADFADRRQACKAAVQAEIDNVAIYDQVLQLELPDDVRQVFEHNRMASQEHHLPAFERCAAGQGAGRRGG
jgi:protein tyrosine phosphatase (PTP) superfamily phosphohydrolase (DUF442 family)/rubrerythrin